MSTPSIAGLFAPSQPQPFVVKKNLYTIEPKKLQTKQKHKVVKKRQKRAQLPRKSGKLTILTYVRARMYLPPCTALYLNVVYVFHKLCLVVYAIGVCVSRQEVSRKTVEEGKTEETHKAYEEKW